MRVLSVGALISNRRGASLVAVIATVAPVGLILDKLKLIASYKAATVLINELAVSLVTLEEERVAALQN